MIIAKIIIGTESCHHTCLFTKHLHYHFGVKFGYTDKGEYWFDVSSYRHVQYINVPFLNIMAQDDFLMLR
jgi:hypothetical protein